jgi:hypothetical protein
MTSKEFVVWMQGFVEACNDYSPTPKQWDTLKGKLAEVSDEPLIGTAIGGWGTPNSAPIQTLPFIQPYPSDPYNPYKITCGTTGESGTTLTVSSGSSGTIIATPGYGSITYNPSTTTIWNPSGSAWSYTSTLPQQQPTTGSNQLELDFEAK